MYFSDIVMGMGSRAARPGSKNGSWGKDKFTNNLTSTHISNPKLTPAPLPAIIINTITIRKENEPLSRKLLFFHQLVENERNRVIGFLCGNRGSQTGVVWVRLH